MAIFPKFFEDFMTHIIRLNRDKEIKLFPELSINKIFGDSFVRFISDRSLNPPERKLAKHSSVQYVEFGYSLEKMLIVNL